MPLVKKVLSVKQGAAVPLNCRDFKEQTAVCTKQPAKEGISNVLMQLSREVDGDEIRM